MLHRRISALALLAPLLALAQPYPATPKKPVSDNYHGTTVVDDYRWMEDMKSTEFQTWLKTQAHYASETLARLPGRAALRARLAQLADAGEQSRGFTAAGERVFFLRRSPGQNQHRLWLREGLEGQERELLDPEKTPGMTGSHAIDWFSPSRDGRHVALGLSKGGSEDSVLRVLEVASGRLLADEIPQTGLNQDGVSWLPDGAGFFYNRNPADERYLKSVARLHKLGQKPAQDRPVFGWGLRAKREFAPPDIPYIHLQRSSGWALAEVLHGDAAERSYWVAPLDRVLKAGAAAPWRRVIAPQDKVIQAQLAGDKLYAISQLRASRRELLSLDLRQPRKKAEPVLPAGEQVLLSLQGGGDGAAVYLKALDGGVSRLWRVGRDGAAAALPLPFEGTLREAEPLPGGQLLLRLEGWVQPAQTLVLDPARPEQPPRVSTLQRAPALDVSGLQARRVLVNTRDGVQLPLSIISAKNAPLDGKRPTILSGYGAYGIVLEPRFSAGRLAWLERGGVSATCHVRGGGELGDEWHRGGYIETKQNTVSDFIACAEWLQANGYAAPTTLAGVGGSAGGITVGGAITQRPGLFAAVQSAVGVSDMLRMELTPNGAPNVAEFGSVTKPEQFKAMYAISPFHRVVDGRDYPAVIVTTGANDPRVDAWMPAKLAARLQAANPGAWKSRPTLLRVDFDGGHGQGAGIKQALDEQADVWSFFLWQMGDPAFQPVR